MWKSETYKSKNALQLTGLQKPCRFVGFVFKQLRCCCHPASFRTVSRWRAQQHAVRLAGIWAVMFVSTATRSLRRDPTCWNIRTTALLRVPMSPILQMLVDTTGLASLSLPELTTYLAMLVAFFMYLPLCNSFNSPYEDWDYEKNGTCSSKKYEYQRLNIGGIEGDKPQSNAVSYRVYRAIAMNAQSQNGEDQSYVRERHPSSLLGINAAAVVFIRGTIRRKFRLCHRCCCTGIQHARRPLRDRLHGAKGPRNYDGSRKWTDPCTDKLLLFHSHRCIY